MLIKCDDEGDDSVCVARTPIRVRMRYLRRVYFVLAVQQFILATASFILYMTPGVRPFVQNYTSTTWSTALALVVSNHVPGKMLAPSG
ncbi:hypothetical protein ANCDUO_09862 [Ancylostoma duodenale]|uniref:Uncharacterized protein n=1 Tax=Ancylostoma duodenale TaxID=51022 RepID=A0A0C2GFH2_9BILA|nr:hypothetical protein ANCDUO_09862 [Ancylostoma duodenale]